MQDKEIVAYIAKAIRNEYIRLSKHNCEIIKHEIPLIDEITPSYEVEEDVETKLLIDSCLNGLSRLQKEVIVRIYLNNEKEKDIAKDLKISRQAVSKTKKAALKNLKKQL